MARLTTAQRDRLPDSDFLGPNRTYPAEDAAHARNALSRGAQNASSGLQASIKRKVASRYPGIEQGKGGGRARGARGGGGLPDAPSTPDLLGAREQYRAALQHHLGQLGPPPRSRMAPPPMTPPPPMNRVPMAPPRAPMPAARPALTPAMPPRPPLGTPGLPWRREAPRRLGRRGTR